MVVLNHCKTIRLLTPLRAFSTALPLPPPRRRPRAAAAAACQPQCNRRRLRGRTGALPGPVGRRAARAPSPVRPSRLASAALGAGPRARR